mgnify:CR=1 FL=1
MGPMTFASGSHNLGKLCDLPIGDESEAAYERTVKEHDLACTEPETFAPGDATFHAGWTMHRAPPNRTDRTREVLGASDVAVVEFRKQMVEAAQAWLAGAPAIGTGEARVRSDLCAYQSVVPKSVDWRDLHSEADLAAVHGNAIAERP